MTTTRTPSASWERSARCCRPRRARSASRRRKSSPGRTPLGRRRRLVSTSGPGGPAPREGPSVRPRRSGYLSIRTEAVPPESEALQHDGYVILPDVFSADEVAALIADLDRV